MNNNIIDDYGRESKDILNKYLTQFRAQAIQRDEETHAKEFIHSHNDSYRQEIVALSYKYINFQGKTEGLIDNILLLHSDNADALAQAIMPADK